MRDSLEFPSTTVTLCYTVRTALLCCSCKLFINSSLADSQSVYVQSIYTVFQTRSSAVAVIAGRTACSILTLFIVSTTSRPLNKKSVCCQTANPINKFAVRTPLHVHCSRQSRHTPRSRRSHRTALFRLAALERNAVTVYQYWDLGCASFLPRDASAQRGYEIAFVCLSVCLSV